LGQPLIAVVLPITPPPAGWHMRGSAGTVEKLTVSATCAFVSQTGFQPPPSRAGAQNQPPSVPRNAEPSGPISQPPGTGRYAALSWSGVKNPPGSSTTSVPTTLPSGSRSSLGTTADGPSWLSGSFRATVTTTVCSRVSFPSRRRRPVETETTPGSFASCSA
jgi:hypothetical protein